MTAEAVAPRRWLAGALLLGAGVAVALGVYGRVHVPTYGAGQPPVHLADIHRATGLVAFVVSLPVAAYCLYGSGFAPAPLSARTLVHSVAGCSFYGDFAAKLFTSVGVTR